MIQRAVHNECMDKPARTDRRLPLSLPPDLYNRLTEQARAADRDPIQQVRFLLRQALDADAEQAGAAK